jgi:hypothetical protein
MVIGFVFEGSNEVLLDGWLDQCRGNAGSNG